MISLFCKHVRDSYVSRVESSKNYTIKKNHEGERSFEKLLEDLHRDDDKDNKRFAKSHVAPSVDLQYKCTKNEGIKCQPTTFDFRFYSIPF